MGLGPNTVRRVLRDLKSPGINKIRKRVYNRNKVHTTINGVRRSYKVENRRPEPSTCELCKKEVKRVEWHHWDDHHLERGMWICLKCHTGAEFIEHGMDKVYLALKEQLQE